MKKFSIIIVLILSISFASASVLARQAVDGYIGYTPEMNNLVEYIQHERGTDDASRHVRQKYDVDTAEFTRGGQNSDDRESRRIGKSVWKSEHVQDGHGNVK
ncbi:MAG: hypothetical protein H0X02_13310 [Nitrosomonas sp.]|nr:hypothetical protein [Nitrosomonas sp.]